MSNRDDGKRNMANQINIVAMQKENTALRKRITALEGVVEAVYEREHVIDSKSGFIICQCNLCKALAKLEGV